MSGFAQKGTTMAGNLVAAPKTLRYEHDGGLPVAIDDISGGPHRVKSTYYTYKSTYYAYKSTYYTYKSTYYTYKSAY